MSIQDLVPGQELSNSELSRIFKCSSQGGMRRSHRTNSLVIVSDYTKQFYEDGWEENTFYYTGMGLRGNQSLQFSQNKTLAESNENGVLVHLFEVFERGKYVYQGEMMLQSKPYQETQSDVDNNERTVWIFPLKFKNNVSPVPIKKKSYIKKRNTKEKQAKRLTTDELKQRVSSLKPKRSTRKIISEQFVRNEFVTEFIKRKANGRCQLCQNPAPFTDKNDQPYLEAHHVVWLSRKGTDTIDNVVALCPNCHRKMHILDSKDDKERLLNRAKMNRIEE
ncbi:MAG: HNH endonuclease [archaeon]